MFSEPISNNILPTMNFRFLLFLIVALATGPLFATSATVSTDYGYSPTDATFFLQAALNDGSADTIIIDAAPGPWIAGPLFLNRSDVVIIFEPATVLLALPNGFGEFERQLEIGIRRNIVIEGNGALIEGRKQDYAGDSEFRHCLSLLGPENVIIRNLRLRNAPGDGLYIGPGYVMGQPVGPTRNVTVTGVVMDGNNRQGCSVADVIGLRMDNCDFLNTSGTLPKAGIDFEPFLTEQRMQDIQITNSRFEGNDGPGILVACIDLDATSPPMDIIIDGCTVTGNCQADPDTDAVLISNTTRAPGSVIIRNSTIEDEPCTAFTVRKYADVLPVRLDNVTIRNVAQTTTNPLFAPIFISPVFFNSPDDDAFGGIDFRDVTIFDDRDRIHFIAYQQTSDGSTPSEPGVSDLTGSVVICTPPDIDPTVDLGVAPGTGNTVTFSDCRSLPAELTDFNIDSDGCAHLLNWSFARGEDIAELAVQLRSESRGWTIIARPYLPERFAETWTDALRLSTGAEAAYRLRVTHSDGSVTYSDVRVAAGCARGTEDADLWPNPTYGIIRFASVSHQRELSVFHSSGRLVQRFAVGPEASSVELGHLPAGIYLARFRDGPARRLVLLP